MAFTPWKTPATITDDATVGTHAWTIPGAGTVASNNNIAGATTHYLKFVMGAQAFTDADFGGHTGQTVNEIDFEFTRKTNTGTTTDFSIKLVKAGAIFGTEQSGSMAWNNGSDRVDTIVIAIPGAGALSQADVEDANFGGVLACIDSAAFTATEDGIRVRAGFTPAFVPTRWYYEMAGGGSF